MSPGIASCLRKHKAIPNQHRERLFHRKRLLSYASFQEPPCDDPLKGVLRFWVVNQVLQYFISNLYFFIIHMVWAIHPSTVDRSFTCKRHTTRDG